MYGTPIAPFLPTGLLLVTSTFLAPSLPSFLTNNTLPDPCDSLTQPLFAPLLSPTKTFLGLSHGVRDGSPFVLHSSEWVTSSPTRFRGRRFFSVNFSRGGGFRYWSSSPVFTDVFSKLPPSVKLGRNLFFFFRRPLLFSWRVREFLHWFCVNIPLLLDAAAPLIGPLRL